MGDVSQTNAKLNKILTDIGNQISGTELEEDIEVFPVPKRKKPVVIKKEPSDELSEEPKEDREQTKVRNVINSLIDVLVGVLCYLNLISTPEELSFELKDDDFVINDMTEWFSGVIAYIPFVGLITGGTTVARHVISHASNEWDDNSDEPEDTPETT